MNKKGQFSIIAATLVAVVLIAAVVTTYATIRYSTSQPYPQIMSAIDEVNLALKQVLGFTVGYYGSVLQVTGNTSYARMIARNYLNSGLENIGDIRPEWGASFNVTSLGLTANWYMNTSYSAGQLTVNYNLTGLGVYGVTYSASCRLDVQIEQSTDSQARLRVIKDLNEPLNSLGKQNFKFYRYRYTNMTWEYVNPPEEPTALSNGTYIITVPQEINPAAYIIQVQDTRGLTVAAASFSRYDAALLWNSTYAAVNHYVDNDDSNVDGNADRGTHSNFAAQQTPPDNAYDTLTETAVGASVQNYNPTSCTPLNGTTLVSGSLTNLTADDAVTMRFRSYPSAYSTSDYSTIQFDNANSAVLTSAANSIQWQHTTGAGINRLLMVAIDIFSSSGTPTTVSSVTYDNTPLTLLATAYYSTNPRVRSYVYYLANPAPGTKTVNVQFQSSTLAIAGSTTYFNVNQTNPFQASNTNTGSGASQSVSLTANGAYTKTMYGHMASYRTNNPYTVNDAQTTRWGQTTQQYKGLASEKPVSSGSVSLSWTTSRTVSWTAIAAVLQPTRLPTEFTCDIEFTGTSNTDAWDSLTWTVDSLANMTGVNLTLQLYNYAAGQYSTSGNGYMSDTVGPAGTLKNQTITVNPTDFRDIISYWRLEVKALKATQTPFDLEIDLIQFAPRVVYYGLDLEEQWVNVNYTLPNQELCIKTGTLGSEPLAVDVWHSNAWQNLIPQLAVGWNNYSVSQYLDSSTFTIRFRSGADAGDTVQDSWQIDMALLRPLSDADLMASLQDSTAVIEVLQNGTMRWYGQELTLSPQTMPIPPVPVSALRVNQTINGVNQIVPFQIEDWASSYTIPLGLTSNATVFGNRQMIVFLVNNMASKFTIWWNGSDEAAQPSEAFTNKYFTSDDPSTSRLSNGVLTLQFSSSFTITSTAGASQSTATFMRINNKAATYGSGLAYVIHHGVVRDIVQQEAEWSGGVDNCPNVYANIVLTLPANASYFTYQLRLMFIDSQKQRIISDICPLSLSTTLSQTQIRTENDTANSLPVVADGDGVFYNYNYPAQPSTMHRWSELVAGTKGAGIMFTATANERLYAFDAIASGATGAIRTNTSAKTIELLPVVLRQVQFTNAIDVTWHGAVATFDGTPIYPASGASITGLWVLAEIPPSLIITSGN